MQHVQASDRMVVWVTALGLIVMCTLLLAPNIYAQAGEWTIECVDCPRFFTGTADRMLRLDAAGHPHMAYGGDYLYYAWHDGATWHHEMVDDSPGVGAGAAFGLDADGYARILYRDAVGHVKYAFRDAAGWHVESTPLDVDEHSPIKVEISSDGVLHAAYDGSDGGDYGLMHASLGGSGWYSYFVTNPGQDIRDLSLAVNAASEPRIAFCLEEGDTLGYMARTGAMWQKDYVETGVGQLYQLSLALDGDEACLAYRTGSTVGYGRRDAGSWSFEAVDATGGKDPSLALDGTGDPHIVYNGVPGAVYHATLAGSTWSTEQMYDGSGVWGGSLSAAVDAADGLRLLHVQGSDLLYTHQAGTMWQTEVVDTQVTAGPDPSLVIDADGTFHLAYRVGTELTYARRGAEGWQREVVPTEPGHSPFDVDMALDAEGRPHIVFAHYYGLRYAYRDTGGWHLETIEPVMVDNPSLGLDSAGQPRVTYVVNYGTRYAYRAGTEWHVEMLDNLSTHLVNHPSLAVDSQDRVHITYYHFSGAGWTNSVVYARLDSTGWYTDPIGTGGHFTSVALDKGDAPHAAYVGSVHYAVPGAAGWQTEAVSAGLGYYVKLELDGQDAPHLAYIDRGADDYINAIKYAECDGETWQIQEVWSAPRWLDVEEYYGWMIDYLSLAVSPQGTPYIAFFDPYTLDLKLASPAGPVTRVYLPLIVRKGR